MLKAFVFFFKGKQLCIHNETFPTSTKKICLGLKIITAIFTLEIWIYITDKEFSYIIMRIQTWTEKHKNASEVSFIKYFLIKSAWQSNILYRRILNPCQAEWIKMLCPLLIFSQIRLLDPSCWYKFTYLMTNSTDPDQLASKEANWSGSTLFAKAGHIWVQQDNG